MSKGLVKVAIGAAIIGAAFLTGGASIVAGALTTTALGGLAVAAGAGIALSGVSQSLAKAPKNAVALSALDRLNASLVPTAPRIMVLGTTAMGTDIRYVEPSGTNQEYIDYIIVVASHRVQSIDQIWIEDSLAWSFGAVQAAYSGYLTVDTRLEGTAANAITINGGTRWNASCRLTGCAYVHLRIKRTGANSKATSPFAQGLPARMTIIGKGMPVYDPRHDDTVPGGSGPMRADDQSTWSFYAPGSGTEIGTNIALQSLSWLLGWKINGKLAVGRGMPKQRLSLPGAIVAANLCDEPVTLAVGGTQPRYHGSGVVSEADDPAQVMQTFCNACNGRYREALGKLDLVIMHNDLALVNADAGLDDSHLIGDFTWNPDPSLEQCFNVVRGRYTDPSTASLYQLVDYPEVRLPSPDGIDRILTLDLPWVEDPSMAQRIAKQTLQRKQYQRTLSAVWNMAGWCYKVGDPVPVTVSALGFSRRTMRVQQQIAGFDGTCPMILEDEADALYAWDNEDKAVVQPAAPIRYDPLNNPIVLAIDDAAQSVTVTNKVKLSRFEAGTSAGWGIGYDPSAMATGLTVDSHAGKRVIHLTFNATAAYASNNGQQVSIINRRLDETRSRFSIAAGERVFFGAQGGTLNCDVVALIRVFGGDGEGAAFDFTFTVPAGVLFPPEVNQPDWSGCRFGGFWTSPVSGTAEIEFYAHAQAAGYGELVIADPIVCTVSNTTTAWPVFVAGPTGTDGATRNSPAGEWGSGNTYHAGDIVTHAGSSYIALQDVPAGIDLGNGAYWQLFAQAGQPGLNGQDGLPGPQGQSVHVAYANSPDGHTDFTTAAPAGRLYIGTRVDQTTADSTNPDDYTWSRFVGLNGANGTPGAPGANGQPTYIHFAYADSADGSVNFSNTDPGTRAYIGVYTDQTVADSGDYHAYAWSLIKGADGISPAPSYPAQVITGSGNLAYNTVVAVAPGQTAYFRTRFKAHASSSSPPSAQIQAQFSLDNGSTWNAGSAGGVAVGGTNTSSGTVGTNLTSFATNSTYTNNTGDTVLLTFRTVVQVFGGTFGTDQPSYQQAAQ